MLQHVSHIIMVYFGIYVVQIWYVCVCVCLPYVYPSVRYVFGMFWYIRGMPIYHTNETHARKGTHTHTHTDKHSQARTLNKHLTHTRTHTRAHTQEQLSALVLLNIYTRIVQINCTRIEWFISLLSGALLSDGLGQLSGSLTALNREKFAHRKAIYCLVSTDSFVRTTEPGCTQHGEVASRGGGVECVLG